MWWEIGPERGMVLVGAVTEGPGVSSHDKSPNRNAVTCITESQKGVI